MPFGEEKRRTTDAREQMAVHAQFQSVKPNEVVTFLLSRHSLPFFDHASELIEDKVMLGIVKFFTKFIKYLKLDLSEVKISLANDGKPSKLTGFAKVVVDEDFLSSVQEQLKTEIRVDRDALIDIRALQEEKDTRGKFLERYGIDDSFAHQITDTPSPDRYEPDPYGRRQEYYRDPYRDPYASGGPPKGAGGKIMSALFSNL